MLMTISGWVPGTQANVFVANHDTERVGLYLIGYFCFDD
jgi:hypothetical protein